MRGVHLARRLNELNIEDASEETRPRSPFLKSPSMSPTKASTDSSSPYALPSASGPGGLVSMLQSLRKIRDSKNKSFSQSDYEKAMETEATPEKSVYFDAHSTLPLNMTTMNKSVDLNHNDMTEDITFEDDATLIEEEEAHNRRLEAFTEASDLEKKIIRQVEYYFGDYNLPKDKWILAKMEENEGWFDMDAMMSFKRLSGLTENPSVVLAALSKSPNGLLQVENWGMGKGRIRRCPNKAPPEFNEARRISMQERTLFVWGFDRASTTLDDLIDFFEGTFKNVVNIRQRTMPVENDDDESSPKRVFMGSVFITFATRRDATRFFEERGKLLFTDSRQLRVKWQKDFQNDRSDFNDEFNEETINRTVLVGGFDKQDTSQAELTAFFKQFAGAIAIRKRVYRFGSSDSKWRFTGGVFVTFDSEERAQAFMGSYNDKGLALNGDSLNVKWQSQFFEEKGKFKRALAGL